MTAEQLANRMKQAGYTNDRARDGLDKMRLGLELGRTYHAVRSWLAGERPVPVYVQRHLGA